MKHQNFPGNQLKQVRQLKKLSQSELAQKCNLNIRTIQRIENGDVKPRLYTLRIIEDVLGVELFDKGDLVSDNKEILKYMEIFKRRKQIRLITFFLATGLLFITLVLLIIGIPKIYWAPFIYFFFFIDLIVIGLTWRCPGCNHLLSDVFNSKYCPNCGLSFYKK